MIDKSLNFKLKAHTCFFGFHISEVVADIDSFDESFVENIAFVVGGKIKVPHFHSAVCRACHERSYES